MLRICFVEMAISKVPADLRSRQGVGHNQLSALVTATGQRCTCCLCIQDPGISFDQNVAREMVVVENPMHAKSFVALLLQDASDFPDTLDPQLLAASIGRLQQNFNSNVNSNRGTFAA